MVKMIHIIYPLYTHSFLKIFLACIECELSTIPGIKVKQYLKLMKNIPLTHRATILGEETDNKENKFAK